MLLASGYWGVARHFQYFFELLAAWSWGLLAGIRSTSMPPVFTPTIRSLFTMSLLLTFIFAGVSRNKIGLFYPIFLTILLVHRYTQPALTPDPNLTLMLSTEPNATKTSVSPNMVDTINSTWRWFPSRSFQECTKTTTASVLTLQYDLNVLTTYLQPYSWKHTLDSVYWKSTHLSFYSSNS